MGSLVYRSADQQGSTIVMLWRAGRHVNRYSMPACDGRVFGLFMQNFYSSSADADHGLCRTLRMVEFQGFFREKPTFRPHYGRTYITVQPSEAYEEAGRVGFACENSRKLYHRTPAGGPTSVRSCDRVGFAAKTLKNSTIGKQAADKSETLADAVMRQSVYPQQAYASGSTAFS